VSASAAPRPLVAPGASMQASAGDAAAGAAALVDGTKLSARAISLTLGSRVVLDDVSFAVKQGEVFGLLGPNGSGKTSLMRCLSGLLTPDLGIMWLEGKELGNKTRALRAGIGVVFQEPSLDDRLTARENLRLAAALFGVRGSEASERAKELLVFMELAGREDEPVRTFSGGMKRRLEIARALIHRPRLLLMDEPTTGLDPHACERIWQRLLALRRLQGLTVVLTTHKAEEAARCDRLLVIDRGHVVTTDTPEGLLGRFSGDILTLEGERPQELADEVRQKLGLITQLVDDKIELSQPRAHELIPRLVELLPPGRLRSVTMRRPTLADAFLSITGRRLDKDGEPELPVRSSRPAPKDGE
jgi:ABC-2 type transport system ATP-binding protein